MPRGEGLGGLPIWGIGPPARGVPTSAIPPGGLAAPAYGTRHAHPYTHASPCEKRPRTHMPTKRKAVLREPIYTHTHAHKKEGRPPGTDLCTHAYARVIWRSPRMHKPRIGVHTRRTPCLLVNLHKFAGILCTQNGTSFRKIILLRNDVELC